eukprot:1460398-Amphidinium_carterae.1
MPSSFDTVYVTAAKCRQHGNVCGNPHSSSPSCLAVASQIPLTGKGALRKIGDSVAVKCAISSTPKDLRNMAKHHSVLQQQHSQIPMTGKGALKQM